MIGGRLRGLGGALACLAVLAHASVRVPGTTVEARAYVPLETLVAAVGGRIEHHADPRRVTLVLPGRVAQLRLDDPFVRVDQRMVELPRAPRLADGELLLPVESVAALSAAAFPTPLAWDARERVVTPAPAPGTPPATRAIPAPPLAAPVSRVRSARVVVLDPGHGGPDAGVGEGALREKDLTLAIARRAAARLAAAGAHVVLTRSADRAVSAVERAEFANRAAADAFVSLHVGRFPAPGARGISVWSPPPAPPAAGGVPLRSWDGAAGAHAAAASALADSLAAAFDRGGFGPAHVRERLAVGLLGVDAPAVLLELGSLASPAERARLASPAGQDSLAAALAAGLRAWGRP